MTATETNGSGKAVRTFPAGFVWGDATAADRIGGGAKTDGSGPSIWDSVSHAPGKLLDVQAPGEHPKRPMDGIWHAIQDGALVDGHFQWSSLPNVESAWGDRKRFGTVFADFGAQHRTPKKSGGFCQQVAIANELPVACTGESSGLAASTT